MTIFQSIVSLVRAMHGLLRCMSASERFSSSPDTVRHFNYWLDLVVNLIIEAIQMPNFVSFYPKNEPDSEFSDPLDDLLANWIQCDLYVLPLSHEGVLQVNNRR